MPPQHLNIVQEHGGETRQNYVCPFDFFKLETNSEENYDADSEQPGDVINAYKMPPSLIWFRHWVKYIKTAYF